MPWDLNSSERSWR